MALEHCFELASHRKGRGRVDNDVDIGVPIRLGEVRREPGGDLTLDITTVRENSDDDRITI